MAQEKILTITPAAWSPEAEQLLARAIRRAPCLTVADYRAMIAADPECVLYRVSSGGELVGFVILRILRFHGGLEGEILAAAGRLPGADLTRDVLPALERLFAGVGWFRITTARPGLVAKLKRQGWIPTHTVLRKAAA